MKNILTNGKHPFFKVAISQGWQGVAYLLLQKGYSPIKAVENSLNQSLFNFVLTLLGKIDNKSSFQERNSKNQNILHVFAIKGNQASNDLTQKIYRELVKGGVDPTQIDYLNRFPLHYACSNRFEFLIDELLKFEKTDLNHYDQEGDTPFSLYFKSKWNDTPSLERFLLKGADLKKKFTVI